MQALILALALSAAPVDVPAAPEGPHALRLNGGVLELTDGRSVRVGPGRWYSAAGGERLDHEWARVQVELAETRTRLTAAEARPVIPGGGVSYGAVAVVGVVALAAGVLLGGLALR